MSSTARRRSARPSSCASSILNKKPQAKSGGPVRPPIFFVAGRATSITRFCDGERWPLVRTVHRDCRTRDQPRNRPDLGCTAPAMKIVRRLLIASGLALGLAAPVAADEVQAALYSFADLYRFTV